MTLEEIQAAIKGMLQVQRELQETQIRQSEEIQQLIAQGQEQDRRIQRTLLACRRPSVGESAEPIVGYSISQAGDVLDVQMSLSDIYARLSKLEDRNKNEDTSDS